MGPDRRSGRAYSGARAARSKADPAGWPGAEANTDERTVVVRATLANLRREPAHASELVSQLVLGEEARVLDGSGSWLRVAGRDGYAGWAHAWSFVRRADSAEGLVLLWSRRDGQLREGAADGAAPLYDLVLGARLRAGAGEAARGEGRVARAAGGRPRPVLLPDGSRAWGDGDGWVAEADLRERFRRTPEALVGTALSLRGVPYLWGGTSSKAFDCSGFVQRVFAMHGVLLPRDAWQQAEVGAGVEPRSRGQSLDAGDLVFFAEGGGRITHVAVALGERGRLLHASTQRAGVGVDSLDPADPLFAPDLAASVSCCRRVL
jgi:cell wall-associated NlpC family hydrolase